MVLKEDDGEYRIGCDECGELWQNCGDPYTLRDEERIASKEGWLMLNKVYLCAACARQAIMMSYAYHESKGYFKDEIKSTLTCLPCETRKIRNLSEA